jgi:hypothetical protein
MSRRHFEIGTPNGSLAVRNLSGTNGTRVLQRHLGAHRFGNHAEPNADAWSLSSQIAARMVRPDVERTEVIDWSLEQTRVGDPRVEKTVDFSRLHREAGRLAMDEKSDKAVSTDPDSKETRLDIAYNKALRRIRESASTAEEGDVLVASEQLAAAAEMFGDTRNLRLAKVQLHKLTPVIESLDSDAAYGIYGIYKGHNGKKQSDIALYSHNQHAQDTLVNLLASVSKAMAGHSDELAASMRVDGDMAGAVTKQLVHMSTVAVALAKESDEAVADAVLRRRTASLSNRR